MVRTQSGSGDAESKSARTRRRILDAAAEVLRVHGYAGTRLGEVAEKAGVQAPAIYYYFASREDLVEEVLHAGIVRMREHLESALGALPDGTPPLRRLSVAIEEHLRHQLDLSTYAVAALRNADQVPEAVRLRYAIEHRAYDGTWARLLTAVRDAGELRPDLDLRLAQALVTGAVNQVAAARDPRRGDIEELVAGTTAFVLRGLT